MNSIILFLWSTCMIIGCQTPVWRHEQRPYRTDATLCVSGNRCSWACGCDTHAERQTIHTTIVCSVCDLVKLQEYFFLRDCTGLVGACGPVDRALHSRSEGLGFDSQCWPCVANSGKLCIPHCLGPPSRNGYLVHRSKVGSIVAGCIGAHLARGKVKSVEHALSWSLDSKQLPLPLPSGD